MKKTSVLIIILSIIYQFSFAQKIFPYVNGFGGINQTTDAEQLIDLNQEYKIMFDVHDGAEKITDINPTYDAIARLLNFYANAGYDMKKIRVVAVIHYTSTPSVLSDESHMFEFKKPNPNTAVINELSQKGVKFYVCGQSLIARKLNTYKRNPNIKVVPGAIVALSHFQQIGYSILKF